MSSNPESAIALLDPPTGVREARSGHVVVRFARVEGAADDAVSRQVTQLLEGASVESPASLAWWLRLDDSGPVALGDRRASTLSVRIHASGGLPELAAWCLAIREQWSDLDTRIPCELVIDDVVRLCFRTPKGTVTAESTAKAAEAGRSLSEAIRAAERSLRVEADLWACRCPSCGRLALHQPSPWAPPEPCRQCAATPIARRCAACRRVLIWPLADQTAVGVWFCDPCWGRHEEESLVEATRAVAHHWNALRSGVYGAMAAVGGGRSRRAPGFKRSAVARGLVIGLAHAVGARPDPGALRGSWVSSREERKQPANRDAERLLSAAAFGLVSTDTPPNHMSARLGRGGDDDGLASLVAVIAAQVAAGRLTLLTQRGAAAGKRSEPGLGERGLAALDRLGGLLDLDASGGHRRRAIRLAAAEPKAGEHDAAVLVGAALRGFLRYPTAWRAAVASARSAGGAASAAIAGLLAGARTGGPRPRAGAAGSGDVEGERLEVYLAGAAPMIGAADPEALEKSGLLEAAQDDPRTRGAVGSRPE